MLQSYPMNGVGSTGSDLPTQHGRAYSKSGAGDQLREWSSLVGIVTAIIGNILISFALNIQRYAHIRIGRELDDNKSWKRGKRRLGGPRDYGTQQQAEVAEERERLNLAAPTEEDGSPTEQMYNNGHVDQDADETEPLKQSFQSDHTLASSEKSSDNTDRKSYLSSPYWWLGIILMTVGEVGNFLAYGFAPASIVSPLGVVALISNCVIAPFMLKERFRPRDLWGVAIAVAGAVTVVLSAKTSEDKMGPQDIWQAITRWEFETYLGITAALIIGLMWASGRYGDRSILIDLGLVGLFGGYTALSTKGVASLLSDTLWRTLTFPVTYLLVFILVFTAVMQIRYINRALQRFDSTQVIPTQFVLFTLSVIIGSSVLYRDFESRTADSVGKFIGGCLLTFFGVYLITSGRPRAKDDIDDEEEEEATIGLLDEEYQDEPIQVPTTRDGRMINKLALATNFDGNGEPITPSRRLSHHVDDDQSVTPRRLRTPSPSRRPSVAFEETPRRDADGGPLLSNPWMSSQERLSRIDTTQSHPGYLQSSLSASAVHQFETPSRSSRPSSPPKTDNPYRPSLSGLSRHSMSRMLPGPLFSPLTSSLSAVVADSLRRGVGMDGTPTRRRTRLGGAFRRARSGRVTRSHTREDRDPDWVFRGEERSNDPGGEEAESSGDRKKRMRSFSDALGWLRTGESRKKREDGDGGDGEDESGGAQAGTPDPNQSRETVG